MKKTKKKSPKKIIKLLIVLFILLVVGLGIYYFLTSEDEENSLTILEKQWIENNKETLIDIEVPNNLGIISNNGEGVIFSFLDYLEKTTSLRFNKISYDYPNYKENETNILSIATLKNDAKIKNNDIPSIPIIKFILKKLNQEISCKPWKYIVDLSKPNNKKTDIKKVIDVL